MPELERDYTAEIVACEHAITRLEGRRSALPGLLTAAAARGDVRTLQRLQAEQEGLPVQLLPLRIKRETLYIEQIEARTLARGPEAQEVATRLEAARAHLAAAQADWNAVEQERYLVDTAAHTDRWDLLERRRRRAALLAELSGDAARAAAPIVRSLPHAVYLQGAES